MGKPLQIRNVPDDVLDALRAKAAGRHLSLSAYALDLLARDAHTPTIAEVLATPGERTTATHDEIVAIIRADRELH